MTRHEQSGSWQGPSGMYLHELASPTPMPADTPEEVEAMDLLQTHTVKDIMEMPVEDDAYEQLSISNTSGIYDLPGGFDFNQPGDPYEDLDTKELQSLREASREIDSLHHKAHSEFRSAIIPPAAS